MKFISVYSSIVLVGKDFTPHVFNSSEFPELGEPDKKTLVLLPIITQQNFLKTKYKISVTPERIDLGYSSTEILPETLKKISTSISKRLKTYTSRLCNGIGINCDVVISKENLGMTGKSYCQKKFLNITNLKEKIGEFEELVNTSKIIYTKNEVRYTIDIEPYFKTKGKDLMVKLNAHQSINEKFDLDSALKKFNGVKKYFLNFHDNFIGE